MSTLKERFEARFCTGKRRYSEGFYVLDTVVDDIPKEEYIKFIEEELALERKRLAEEIRGMKRLTDNCICADDGMHYHCDKSFNQALESAVTLIEQSHEN